MKFCERVNYNDTDAVEYYMNVLQLKYCNELSAWTWNPWEIVGLAHSSMGVGPEWEGSSNDG